MNTRVPFNTFCFALVICKNSDGLYLAVNETNDRGWWIPGGIVEPNEDFFTAAKRETKEETGIDIEITGILRIEHSLSGKASARMRVIFFALPVNEVNILKNKSDKHSECAEWLRLDEIASLREKGLLRGDEIYYWPKYIEQGGMIAPITFFTDENEKVNQMTIQDVIRYTRKSSVGKKSSGEIKIMVPEEEFLHFLKENNVVEMKKLLSHDIIDINKPINDKKWTPLILSIKKKNEEMVSLLLIMNVNLQCMTHKKRTCLHFAVQSTFKIFTYLMIIISSLDKETKINLINQQDVYGDTALHIAAWDLVNDSKNEYTQKIYDTLVSEGGNPDIKNNVKLTASIILEKNIK